MLARYQKELVFHRTPWVIGKWFRSWEMKVPDIYSADIKVFHDNARKHIHRKLVEELVELDSGVKFQLALKVSLKKCNTDESEEFTIRFYVIIVKSL